MDEFLNGGTLHLVKYGEDSKWVQNGHSHIKESKPADEVIAAAEELAKNWKDYKLFADCEDFAIACKTQAQNIPQLQGKVYETGCKNIFIKMLYKFKYKKMAHFNRMHAWYSATCTKKSQHG